MLSASCSQQERRLRQGRCQKVQWSGVQCAWMCAKRRGVGARAGVAGRAAAQCRAWRGGSFSPSHSLLSKREKEGGSPSLDNNE